MDSLAVKNPFFTNGVTVLHQGDARHIPLGNESIHCVVTSPPYWGLRDYGIEGGIGDEPTLAEYVSNVADVCDEIRRVLRNDGTLWLNLGDSYASSWGNYHPTGTGGQRPKSTERYDRPAHGRDRRPPSTYPGSTGLAPKNLLGQPWRVAFELQDRGWILRSAIVWSKPNPMPESIKDRPSSVHEMVFLLAKQGRYFYDDVAIRERSTSGPSDIKKMLESKPRIGGKHKHLQDPLSKANSATNIGQKRAVGLPGYRNARNVWTIATQPHPETHFAIFPDELARRCILAGTSAYGCCQQCGAPYVREVERSPSPHDAETGSAYAEGSNANRIALARQAAREAGAEYGQAARTVSWKAQCDCSAPVIPPVVLDPFVGSGTTCQVAQKLGRHSVGIDMNPDYLTIAERRIVATPLPMQMYG